ncbi:MAG: hypothetical protein P8O07_01535 [Crocinitomicaceae bacterium]|nr:hypothetical protein [Crocinitomicaceae bacterium]
MCMLYDTSIKDKETKQVIDSCLGRPYRFLDLFKQGVIGSSRIEITSYSKLFVKVMSQRKQAVFANISLRPKGIVVIMNIRLSNYSWVIPYHYLSIFKTDVLVIHGQGEYLKLKIEGNQNKRLIEKILEYKQEVLENHETPSMG